MGLVVEAENYVLAVTSVGIFRLSVYLVSSLGRYFGQGGLANGLCHILRAGNGKV